MTTGTQFKQVDMFYTHDQFDAVFIGEGGGGIWILPKMKLNTVTSLSILEKSAAFWVKCLVCCAMTQQE